MNQPVVSISHTNLRHNVRRLVNVASPSGVMLAVKTNAYGHGLVEVSQTAIGAGVTALAVLEVTAGVTLRQTGIDVPIFAWLLGDEDDYRLASQHDIDLGISSLHELELSAGAMTATTPLAVHLKIDTGLTRNGASENEWPGLCARAADLEAAGRIVVRGIWSHLADASPEDDAASLEIFNRAVDVATRTGLSPRVFHLGASSAGLRFPESRMDFVRFGIAAYGVSPFDDASAADLDVRPVMTVTAPVVRNESGVLVVAAGFGHGILVGDHPDRFVTLNGHECRVLNVDVDFMRVVPHVNLGPHFDALVGQAVTIFGEGGPSAELLGSWCDTIGDEVLTSVSSRLPRVHVSN